MQIIDQQSVIGKNNIQYDLLKIRSIQPVNFKGSWSNESSSLWTNESKFQCNFNGSNSNIIWISFDEFRNNFQNIAISFLNQDQLFAKVLRNFIDSRNIVRMICLDKTHLFLTLTQKDHRLFSQQQEYSAARILVAQIRPDGTLNFIDGIFAKNQRDIDLNLNLEEGEYLVLIQMYWNQNNFKKVVLNSYSQNRVEFMMETEIEYNISQQLLMKNCIQKYPQQVVNLEHQIKKKFGSIFGFKYYFYKNKSRTHSLVQNTLQLQFPYIKMVYPQDFLEENYLVPPQQSLLLIFESEDHEDIVSLSTQKITKNFQMPTENQIKLLMPQKLPQQYYFKTQKFDKLQMMSITDDQQLNITIQEYQMISKIDQIIPIPKKYWGYIILCSFFVALLINIVECIIKPNFLDLTVLLIFHVLILNQRMIIQNLKEMLLVCVFSCLEQIFWFCMNSKDSDFADISIRHILLQLIDIKLWVSWCMLVYKFLLMYMIWRYSVLFKEINPQINSIIDEQFYI